MKKETANNILAGSAALGVVITAITALFIANQALIMREQVEIMHRSSRAPFESNLQDRIMKVCADFSYYADHARSRVTFWSSVKRKEPSAAHFKLNEREIYSDALTALFELGPKIDQIKFFSEGKSSDKLRSLESRITEFQLYLLNEKANEQEEKNILEWWDERVGFIKKRCRSVLTGNLKGLL